MCCLGMVELVPSSDTLRKIQVEYGVTGSFKDKPLAEWLRKYNPAEDEYEKVKHIKHVCTLTFKAKQLCTYHSKVKNVIFNPFVAYYSTCCIATYDIYYLFDTKY